MGKATLVEGLIINQSKTRVVPAARACSVELWLFSPSLPNRKGDLKRLEMTVNHFRKEKMIDPETADWITKEWREVVERNTNRNIRASSIAKMLEEGETIDVSHIEEQIKKYIVSVRDIGSNLLNISDFETEKEALEEVKRISKFIQQHQ
jgi:hypothetical protein